jgi:hypothetical protein
MLLLCGKWNNILGKNKEFSLFWHQTFVFCICLERLNNWHFCDGAEILLKNSLKNSCVCFFSHHGPYVIM